MEINRNILKYKITTDCQNDIPNKIVIPNNNTLT